jgi:hypothetical protein
VNITYTFKYLKKNNTFILKKPCLPTGRLRLGRYVYRKNIPPKTGSPIPAREAVPGAA